MRLFLVFLSLYFIIGCTGPKGRHSDPKVILISIDGLRSQVIQDPTMHGYGLNDLPNFRRLKERGTYIKKVTTVFPSLTYPSHTSMITGEFPAVHGILHNRPFNPETNYRDWYWWADSIHVPTLITKAHEKGLVTLGISWPVTVGAPMTYMLPEYQSVWDTISTINLIRRHDVPRYYLEEAKLRGIIKANKTPTGYERDILLNNLFMYSFNHKLPHLSLYHIIQTDFNQHDFGADSPEAREAYIFADSLLGRILDYLDSEDLWETTSLIVTGDHGFEPYDHIINLNRLLMNNGLQTIESNGNITEWDAVCYPSGGSAFVRLKYPGNEALRNKLRTLLSRQEGFTVVEQNQLPNKIQVSPREDFILLANEGYKFTRNSGIPYLSDKTGGHHGGDPNKNALKTTFLGIGRGFQPGVEIDSLHITQVAPIISALLDLDLNCTAAIPPWFMVIKSSIQNEPRLHP